MFHFFFQPADVLISHVRHFFEHQLFDFGLGEFLNDVPGSPVIQKMVAHVETLMEQRLAQFHDSLFIMMQPNQGPGSVKTIFQRHHLSLGIKAARFNDVEGFIHDHFLPFS